MQELIGKQIGRYKIIKKIGEGGMAYVYLAEDLTLHRQVALKIIRTSEIPPSQLQKLLERFKREAEALARLSDDPGIVTVYDYGEFEATPYLVMAYMPGGTLKDRLGQPMDYREAARLLLPVAEALSEAHKYGIIHRDVKPSNLLVDKRGNLALADFGIAKALEMDGQTLTGTGMGVGTPEYMAPEQWKGEATFQTDIYSLGVVFYEMVTGKKPYSAGTPSEVFLKQMTQPPVNLRELVPGLPESVEVVLGRAMDREPGARFASMAHFHGALEGLLASRPVHGEIPIVVAPKLYEQKPETVDTEATVDELVFPQKETVLGDGGGTAGERSKEQYAQVKPDDVIKPITSIPSQKSFWKKYGALVGIGMILLFVIVIAFATRPALDEQVPAEATVFVEEAVPAEEDTFVGEDVTPEIDAPECTLKIVNLINGVQGDKSFFDSSVRGTTKAEEDYGVCVKIIEAGIDPAKWQPALEDAAANEDYDMMIMGTFQMFEFLQVLAQDYPDKKFVIYDAPVNYDDPENDVSNVYSVSYKQNEGSYLAGYYAGLMTKTGIIGAVGGQDIPIINDFIVGYKQGAVDAGLAEADVIVQYAGSWNDPAKGKEIALAMYQQGADIVFQIAGGTGVGVFEAAKEMGKWAIGVDSDQATIMDETNPDQAARILTSMMKNVDYSLYRAIGLELEGRLGYGTVEALGVSEGGVGLAYNKFYDENTPDDVMEKMKEVEQALINGEITVVSVFW